MPAHRDEAACTGAPLDAGVHFAVDPHRPFKFGRHFFLAELLFADSGRTLELGIGADADVGFAWSGGGDGAGAGRAQPATGSSTTIAKFCSTDSGLVCGVLSLRHFRLARWCSLSLGGWSPKNPARRISTCSGRLGGAAAAGRTMVMSPAAPDSFSVIFRFGADDGARAIGATDDAAAVELRGRRRRQP